MKGVPRWLRVFDALVLFPVGAIAAVVLFRLAIFLLFGSAP